VLFRSPWRARNVVRWCRPNPPVGALGDKFRPATSELVVACKSANRWFDLDAVRTEPTSPPQRFFSHGYDRGGNGPTHDRPPELEPTVRAHPAGAPPLDWWEIPTEPYAGAHYATWPRRLLDRPILAMCPRRVCTVCGQPSRRITQASDAYEAAKLPADDPWRSGKAPKSVGQSSIKLGGTTADYVTLGWSDCGHDDAWRRGLVLDPFAGSGTTLEVAVAHGRTAIGIDLDGRNADLARDRCGMFLTVEHLGVVV